ncbi:hypothetical protein [Escherichia coli]|uniref:hypothetical protein n=1 Tax=Escherichia coli TaxID=562 RepID=UPI00388CF1C9
MAGGDSRAHAFTVRQAVSNGFTKRDCSSSILITVNVDETVVFLRRGEGFMQSDSTPVFTGKFKCGIAPTTFAPKRNASSSNAFTVGIRQNFLREGDNLQINPRRDFPLHFSIASAQLALHPKHRHKYAHAECRWAICHFSVCRARCFNRHGLSTLCARPSVQCLSNKGVPD